MEGSSLGLKEEKIMQLMRFIPILNDCDINISMYSLILYTWYLRFTEPPWHKIMDNSIHVLANNNKLTGETDFKHMFFILNNEQ